LLSRSPAIRRTPSPQCFVSSTNLGFDPVDGGDLDESWRQQPGTPAYGQDLEAAALRRALAEADRSRIAEYRAEQEACIRRYSAAQTA
jgi:hypothetical protein